MISEELLEKYRKHPRILEIRFALSYKMFEDNYGTNMALGVFEGLCFGFKRNFSLINSVINKRFDIMRMSKTNRVRWKQEVTFVGACYKIKTSDLCRRYLNIAPTNFYSKNSNYLLDNFIDKEWLEKLDDEAIICNSYVYQTEINGFLDMLNDLESILGR